MPQSCCVVDCTHYRHKYWHCRLFRFPIDKHRARQWEKNIARGNWKRQPWHRICECHFEEQEFEQHRKDGRKKLLPTAVPSIFPTHHVQLLVRSNCAQTQLPSDNTMEDADEEMPTLHQLLLANPSHNQMQLPSDPTMDDIDDEQSAWQLMFEEGDSLNTHIDTGYTNSFGETVSVQETRETLELSAEMLNGGGVSPNLDLHNDRESTILQRCRQEITLLRQTLHSYKQRAWHMDVVLAALRRENECLRSALHELNPACLSSLLDEQSS